MLDGQSGSALPSYVASTAAMAPIAKMAVKVERISQPNQSWNVAEK